MSKAVVCLAKTEIQASSIVERLSTIGVRDRDISVLFPKPLSKAEGLLDWSHHAPQGAAIGGGAGGITGGVLGWLAGMGMLMLPGVGPVLAAGPIVALLSGAAVGATLGGITGALVGMGIPADDATVYETKVRDGNILIFTHVPNTEEARIVHDIYRQTHASDISIMDDSRARRTQA